MCGVLQLCASRQITFEATAYNDEGHMLKYILSGTWGVPANSTGASLSENRPSLTGTWNGRLNHNRIFTVSALPPVQKGCSALTFN